MTALVSNCKVPRVVLRLGKADEHARTRGTRDRLDVHGLRVYREGRAGDVGQDPWRSGIRRGRGWGVCDNVVSADPEHRGHYQPHRKRCRQDTPEQSMPPTPTPRLLDQHLGVLGAGRGDGIPCRRERHRRFPGSIWYYPHGTMKMQRVDKGDSVALYDVVAAEIRRAIADGEAGPGERMPRAVDLAAILGVNKNTVIRALHILRDEGLLDFTRGRGVRVVGTPQKSSLLSRIDELLEFARSQGYKREEVAAIIAGQGPG